MGKYGFKECCNIEIRETCSYFRKVPYGEIEIGVCVAFQCQYGLESAVKDSFTALLTGVIKEISRIIVET